MRIAVTGSSGRVGAMVVRQLLDHGHAVLPIDMRPGTDVSFPPTRVIDLTHIDQLQPAFADVDAVCHLGNFPGFRRLIAPVDGYINNAAATFNVFQAAEMAGIKRVVNASSIQVYGMLTHAPEIPVSVPRYLPIDEDHPALPCDAYPLSKLAGENIAQTFARRRKDLSAYSLRFTYVRPPGVPPAAPRSSLLTASFATYIDVADAARAVRLCCELERPGHIALNIVASQALWPWSREMLQQTYGSVPEFRAALKEDESLISGRRAAEILGFTVPAIAPVVAPQAAS